MDKPQQKLNDKKDGNGKKILKGLLAVSVLSVVVAVLVYFFSGFSFFSAGKGIALGELSDRLYSEDGSISLSLDKGKMSGELIEGSSSFDGSIIYSDGALRLSSDDSIKTFQVAEANVFYYGAKNVFLVGAKQ